MVAVEVASDVAGNAGLSCSVFVPSSCGVRSSSIKSDRKLLDGAGCWSSMCIKWGSFLSPGACPSDDRTHLKKMGLITVA